MTSYFVYFWREIQISISLMLKTSRNKKDLNDVTAAPFSVFFCCWQLRKRHRRRAAVMSLRSFLFSDNFSWDSCYENRFFPVRNTTQENPCFRYRDGFAVCDTLNIMAQHLEEKQNRSIGRSHWENPEVLANFAKESTIIWQLTAIGRENGHLKPGNLKP